MAPITLRIHRLHEELACLEREQEWRKPEAAPAQIETPPTPGEAEAERVYLPLLTPQRFLYRVR